MRQTLRWSPMWEGPTKTWTIQFLKKNKWRCDRVHDQDDLLQDAYLTFLKISRKYPRVMEQAHFMTLYRRALWNEMHDRARYVHRKRTVHLDTSIDATELCALRIGEMTNEGYLNLLIEQAPEELKLALECLGQNPPELHQQNGHRENLNMKLRRVLHCQGYDFTNGMRSLLT